MKINFKRVGWTSITIIYVVFTFIISRIPNSALPFKLSYKLIGIRTDWLLHFVEYGILAFLLYCTILTWTILNHKVSIRFIIIWLLSGAIGAVNELLQKATPGREPAFDDILANLLGAAFALSIVYVFKYLYLFQARKFQTNIRS